MGVRKAFAFLTPIIYARILILLKIYVELGLNMHFFQTASECFFPNWLSFNPKETVVVLAQPGYLLSNSIRRKK